MLNICWTHNMEYMGEGETCLFGYACIGYHRCNISCISINNITKCTWIERRAQKIMYSYQGGGSTLLLMNVCWVTIKFRTRRRNNMEEWSETCLFNYAYIASCYHCCNISCIPSIATPVKTSYFWQFFDKSEGSSLYPKSDGQRSTAGCGYQIIVLL